MATHVFEAVIVSIIMTSAIIFVGTFQISSTPVISILEANLAPHVLDLLRITDDLPSTACGAHNQLEQLIVEGASGKHDYWKERIAAALGPGVESGMVLDNLHGLYPLHGDTNMIGDTRDLTIQPDFGQPTSIVTTPATGASTLKIDVPSARYSELLRLKGDAVRTTIHSMDLTGTRSYHTWTPTAILDGYPREGIQDIGWNMTNPFEPNSPWNLTLIVKPNDLTNFLNHVSTRLSLHINGTISESGVHIPAKTSLQIDFPRGWSVDDSPNLPWSFKSSSSPAGVAVTFVTSQEIAGGYDIKIIAHPPASPARPFDVIRAHAFNGSFGESTLLVQYPVPASPDLPRQVFPTTPYPVRPGTMALFGASFANGGDNTTVTQLDIEIPGGYDVWMNRGTGAQIFNTTYDKYSPDIVGVDDHGGSWKILDVRHAQWKADPARPVVVPALSVAWWAAELPITNRTDQATSIEPLVGEGPSTKLTFPNGFTINSTAWGKSPGIIEVAVPNETTSSLGGTSKADGYSTLPADSTFKTVVKSARGYQYASGSFDSVTTNAGGSDSAAANSTFSVQKRLAPLGSLARVDANFESTMNQLSANGITDSNITIDLYAPPNFGCAPTHSWTISGKSLPHPAVRSLVFADITGLGSPDAFIGIEDHRLYRVNAQGSAVWATSLASTAQRISFWDGGPAHRAILAGDDTGMLYDVDAVTGSVSWRVCVAATACDSISATARGVTSIAVNVTQDRIATTTADGRLTLLSGAGVVASHRDHGTYAYSQFLRDRVLMSQNESGEGALELLDTDHDLQVLQLKLGHWLAAAPGAEAGEHTLHLVNAHFETTLNDSTLVTIGTNVDFGLAVPLSTAWGDASGDSVPEVAVAMQDKSVWVFDGATNAPHTYATPLIPSRGQFPELTPRQSPAILTCNSLDGGPTWDLPDCNPPSDDSPLDQNAPPPLLVVGTAGIVHEYAYRGGARVTLLDADARAKWSRYVTYGHAPTALASGKWGATDAIGIGYDDGATEDWPTTLGTSAPSQTVSPSSVSGTFTFSFPIPSGGFFGSHLIVANLSWVDTSGASRSVRLADWLEVVSADGVPVAHPTYRAVIAFEPREAALRSHG